MLGMRKLRPATYAWFGLVGFVTTADFHLIKHNYDTMSCVWGDSLCHPIKRWPLILSWVILTLHLFGRILPDRVQWIKKYDPIGFVARLAEGSSD